jgi:hypothetical protein
MSLTFARELLKRSLSDICDRIGFDRTSELAMDILVDVCERQFHYEFKRIAHLGQFEQRAQVPFVDLIPIVCENNVDNFEQFNDYIQQFPSSQLAERPIVFPRKKVNQLFLRIPLEDSEQVQQRDEHQSTEYIYSWLPLFPHRKTRRSCVDLRSSRSAVRL